MIDNITVTGRIKQVHAGIPCEFDKIARLRHSAVKILTATSYLNSPLTGAQMEVLPTIEEHEGHQWLHLTIMIPVAVALAGQNMIHNGLEALPHELQCLRRLLRWVLSYYQFITEEIELYLLNLEVQLLELAWHTATASRRAARRLQARTIAHFMALEVIKGRHDVQVAEVNVWWHNGKTCMVATFKDGSKFRQYIKAEQAASRTKNERRAGFVSKGMRPHFAAISTAIDTHLRNEAILSPKLLAELGLLHPRNWTVAALEAAIGRVIAMGHLDQCRVLELSDLDRSGLSSEVLATAERYFAGDVLADSMSPQVLSTHRLLLQPKKLDIAEKHQSDGGKSISRAGMLLQYSKRWVPDSQLSGFAIGDQFAPLILDALGQELAEMEDARQFNRPSTDDMGPASVRSTFYGKE